jgi:hypothetical protein
MSNSVGAFQNVMLMTVTVRVKLHMTDYELYRGHVAHTSAQKVHFVLLEMKIDNASPLVL